MSYQGRCPRYSGQLCNLFWHAAPSELVDDRLSTLNQFLIDQSQRLLQGVLGWVQHSLPGHERLPTGYQTLANWDWYSQLFVNYLHFL